MVGEDLGIDGGRHTAVMDGPASRQARARQFDLSVVALLLGASITLVGVAGGLMPLVTRDASACLYNITPPAEFVAKYQEGITATEETISLLPFGAQCSYFATSTGEVAVSIVPLWPTFALFFGLVGVAMGVLGLVVSYRTDFRRPVV